MSYYNPKIYNYSNLHRDDQMTVDVVLRQEKGLIK